MTSRFRSRRRSRRLSEVYLLLFLLTEVISFSPNCSFQSQSSLSRAFFQASANNSADDDDNDLMNELASRAEEIQVEKARTKLEEDNTRSFLKRRPRKLPYEDARRWVQGNLGCQSREEFYDLVENGNLRTPYIPKRPEEYYTRTRDWISWEHFLTGCFDGETPSGVKPQSGIFD